MRKSVSKLPGVLVMMKGPTKRIEAADAGCAGGLRPGLQAVGSGHSLAAEDDRWPTTRGTEMPAAD
jgi:hypothetical protein